MPFLLKPPSPLAKLKSETEKKNWLQAHEQRFALVRGHNEGISGVRIALGTAICPEYLKTCSCECAQGMCSFWHICKGFLEGNCRGKCKLSHNFFDEGNIKKTRNLGLGKHPNGTLRNAVACSLPQVCQLYLRNECKGDKCPCLHVCPQEVHRLSCDCALSHNLIDQHNMKVLKQYDFKTIEPPTKIDLFRCSILIMKRQKRFRRNQFPGDSGAAVSVSNAVSKIMSHPAQISPPPIARHAQSNAAVDTASNSSLANRTERCSHMHSRMKGEKRKKKQSAVKGSICNHSQSAVNNLGSTSKDKPDSLDFLNILAEDDDDLSDSSLDENSSANLSTRNGHAVPSSKRNNQQKDYFSIPLPKAQIADTIVSKGPYPQTQLSKTPVSQTPVSKAPHSQTQVSKVPTSQTQESKTLSSQTQESKGPPLPTQTPATKRQPSQTQVAKGPKSPTQVFRGPSEQGTVSKGHVSENQVSKGEPSQTQACKVQLSQPQSSKVQPSQIRESKRQPSQTQATKDQTAQNQAFKGQPSQNQGSKNQPSQTQTSKSEPSPIQASKSHPSQTQASKGQFPPTKASKSKHSQTQASKGQPKQKQAFKGQSLHSQTFKDQPSQTQPSKGRPSQTKASQDQPLQTQTSEAIQVSSPSPGEVSKFLTSKTRVSKSVQKQSQGSEPTHSQVEGSNALVSKINAAASQAQVHNSSLSQTQVLKLSQPQTQVSHAAFPQTQDLEKAPPVAPVAPSAPPKTCVSQVPPHQTLVAEVSHQQIPVPLPQAQVPPALLTHYQLSEALLSQYRLSQVLLSQTQVYQALLSQAQLSPTLLPHGQTSQMPSSDDSEAAASQALSRALLPPAKALEASLSQVQINHSLDNQTSQVPSSQASQAPPSQEQVPQVPFSSTKASEASLPRAQIPLFPDAKTSQVSSLHSSQAPLLRAQVSQDPFPAATLSEDSLSQAQMPLPIDAEISQVSSPQASKAPLTQAQEPQTSLAQTKTSLPQDQMSLTTLPKAQVIQSPPLQIKRVLKPQLPKFQVLELPSSLVPVPHAPPSQTKVFQDSLPQTKVTQGLKPQIQVPQIPRSENRVFEAPLSGTKVSQLLPQGPSHLNVFQTPMSSLPVSQVPLSQNHVSRASVSNCGQLSSVSLLQIQASKAAVTKTVTHRPSSLTEVSSPPLSKARGSSFHTEMGIPSQTRMSSKLTPQARVSQRPSPLVKMGLPSPADVSQEHTLHETRSSRAMLKCSVPARSKRLNPSPGAYSPTKPSDSASWDTHNESFMSYSTTRPVYQLSDMTSISPYRPVPGPVPTTWSRTPPTSAQFGCRLHEKGITSNKKNRKILGTVTVVVMGSIIFALYFYLLIYL